MITTEKKLSNNGHNPVERTIQTSLQLLPLIMNNIPQAVFWKDRNLVYLGCNQAFADDAGISSPNEIIGKTDFDMPWKEQADLYRADDRLVMENGVAKLNYEEPQTTPDGSRTWLRTNKIPVQENGEVVAVLGMYEDITERKRVEESLRQSEATLSSALHVAKMAYWQFDLDTELFILNDQYYSLHGMTAQQAGGYQLSLQRFAQEFVYPEDAAIVGQATQQAIESTDPNFQIRTEARIMHADGQPRWVTVWFRAEKDAQGRTIRLHGVNQDITERKQAETELQQEKALSDAIINGLPGVFYLFDAEGKLIRWNKQYEKVLGYTTEETATRNAIDPIAEEHRERTFAAIQRAFVEGQGSVEADLVTKEGRHIPFYFVGLRLQIGDQFYLAGTGIDITDRKRLEAQIQEAFERRGLQVQLSTQVSQSIAAASSLEELYERVVTQVKEQFGYYHTQLLRYDPAQEAVMLVTGYGEIGAKMLAAGHRLPMGEGLIGTAASTGATVLRPTLENDLNWQPNSLLPQTKGEIAVPIKLGDTILGVLDVQSNVAGALGADDQLLLEGLCGQIATAIDSTRLHQEMSERLEEINRLYRAMSHEGWQSYRETAGIPSSFMFDQGVTTPVQDDRLVDELFAKVPLMAPGGETIGTLAIADDPQRPISPDDQSFVEQVAEQVALALESARLFEQTQTALVESEETQKLIRNVIDSTDDWIFVKDRQHRYQLVNQGYARALHISAEAFIGKTDLDLGFPEEMVKGNPEKGIRGFWTDDRLVLDTGLPQHFADDPVMIDDQVRIFDTIKIPLRDASGTIWGVLAFARDLTERKQAEQIIAQRALQLETVAKVSSTTSTVLNPDELLQSVVDLTKERFGLYHAHIYLIGPDENSLVLTAGSGEVGKQMLAEGWSIPVAHELSIIADAYRRRQSVVANDVYHDKESTFLSNRLLPDTRSEIALPLTVGDQVLGVFDVQSDKPNQFTAEDVNIYTTLASQVAVTLQNARLYEQTQSALSMTQESEARLSEALKIARLAHWEYDVEGDIFTFNDHFYSIFRTTAEQVGGYKLSSAQYAQLFVHPEDMPVVGVEIEKALTSTDRHYNVKLEHRILFADGGVGYISVDLHVERDENGKIIRYHGANQDITERKTAEEILRVSEARLSEALAIAKLANWEYDFDRDRFIFNDHFYSIFHTTAEQVGGYEVSSADYARLFVHPEDGALVGEEIGKAVASTDRYYSTKLEHRILFADGGIGYIAVDVHIERDESGKIIRWHGANQDITERKRAEETIKAEQQRVQLILESVTIPMVITRLADNQLTFVNSPALGITQFNYEDVINQPAPDFYYNLDDRKKFITELRAKGEVSDMVVQLRRQNGEAFWALLSARVFDYQSEKSILTTFIDITDRIRAQESVSKRAAELQTVAEVSTTTATTLEPDRLLQAVVDLTKERFGLYHAHIYLTDESWDTLLLAAGAGEVGRKLVAEEHSIPISLEQSLVARAARERASIIVNNVNNEPGFLPNPLLPETLAEMAVPMIVGDKVVGVFDVQSNNPQGFSAEDASIYTTLASQVAVALQNARLYVEQAAAVTQLRELDRLKSSFLANMSHELRTPLNSILGFADVILEELDGPLTVNMDNDLRLIQKNGQHLLHLINDVLDMAKIEAGRMNLSPEKFRLYEVLGEVTGITSTLASEKNLALFIDDESDQELEVYADRTRLRQVMINLVNNSIKFTEIGKISLKLVPTEGARVLITVKDTGIGIPPDKLEAVFQEFTQVDTSSTRKVGGTGLGLPISRRLVEMHGGRLWAESTGVNGEGCVFLVELPIEARITEVIEKQSR